MFFLTVEAWVQLSEPCTDASTCDAEAGESYPDGWSCTSGGACYQNSVTIVSPGRETGSTFAFARQALVLLQRLDHIRVGLVVYSTILFMSRGEMADSAASTS